jgi:NADPH2:quinone reductase
MKAAFFETTGGPEVIRYGELPKPTFSSTQVLIRTEAVAVNPIDTYLRSGAIQMPLPQPYVIGCDLAGIVTEVGSDVKGIRKGDRVWSTNQGLLGRQGTFAEYCAVDADWVYPLPDGVPADAAAACALVGVTAHLGLFREGRLRAGHILFVRGGSGGVGSMVVQMAKAAGAVVITTASTDAKADFCRKLGADLVINYKTEDVVQKTKAFAPNGVKLYWETAREPAFDLAVELLAERGRIILMAGRDARPQFPVGPFYVKGCSIHGFVMFKASAEKLRLAAEDINGWMTEGKLKPQIGKTLPLSEAAEAHRLQEANTLQGAQQLCGKIVLKP